MQLTPDGTSIATFILACVTSLVVLGTFWLAYEARATRVQAEKQRKELAFRAALVQLSENIISFEQWIPQSGSYRSDVWWSYPMRFSKVEKLLTVVWVHTMLWQRVTGLLVVIKGREYSLKGAAESFQDTTRYNPAWEGFQNNYYVINLCLKQLARFVFHEMRRQNLSVPADLVETMMFKPLAWRYGLASDSTEKAANDINNSFGLSFPKEPDDPAFRECRFMTLIAEALDLLEKKSRMVQEALVNQVR